MSVLQSIFTVDNLLMMNIGLAVGIIIGAMPGLSVAFAVTVLMTMTFHMESLPAMYLLLGAYCGGFPVSAGRPYNYTAAVGIFFALAGFLLLLVLVKRYPDKPAHPAQTAAEPHS